MGQNSFITNKKSSMLLVIVCTGVIVILQSFGLDAIELFRYENTIFKTGEWWRLLSGHFIHLGWAHLVLNLAGMWIIVFIFHPLVKPMSLLVTTLLLATGTSLGLLLFSSEVVWYIGLSGILHGFITMGAIVNFRSKTWLSILLLAFITTKLLWEQFFADSSTINVIISGKVIYNAHLYGAITGILIITIFNLIFSFSHHFKFFLSDRKL